MNKTVEIDIGKENEALNHKMMNMTQFELPMTSSPLYSGGGGQDHQTEDGDKEFERGASRKAAKNVTPVDVRTLQRHEVKYCYTKKNAK